MLVLLGVIIRSFIIAALVCLLTIIVVNMFRGIKAMLRNLNRDRSDWVDTDTKNEEDSENEESL